MSADGETYYARNRERLKVVQAAYREANRERLRKAQRERDRALSPEAKAAILLRQKPASPAVRARAKATRKARKDNPMAKTSLGRFLFRVFEDQRKLLEDITGERHDVDHIVPLCSGGQHVPWNLRVLPAVENRRRPRIV